MNIMRLNSTPTANNSTPTASNANTAWRRYYALRKGRFTRCCIYVQFEDLYQQVHDYDTAEYETFDVLEDALKYITTTVGLTVGISTSTLTRAPTASSSSSSSSSSSKCNQQEKDRDCTSANDVKVVATPNPPVAAATTQDVLAREQQKAMEITTNRNTEGATSTSMSTSTTITRHPTSTKRMPSVQVRGRPSSSSSSSSAKVTPVAQAAQTSTVQLSTAQARSVISVYGSNHDNRPRDCSTNGNSVASTSSTTTTSINLNQERPTAAAATTAATVTAMATPVTTATTATTAIHHHHHQQQQQQQHAVVPVYADKWTEMFEALKKHKETYSTLDNVRANSKLGRWMTAQRFAYQKLNNHNDHGDDDDNDNINDDDNDNNDDNDNINDDDNDNNDDNGQQEQKSMLLEAGDVNSTNSCSNNTNYENQMGADKIQKLLELGFDFEPPKKAKKRTKSKTKPKTKISTGETDEEWNKMYEELKKFVEEHGHCIPPVKNSTPLRRWFEKQRNEYRKIRAGEESHLTMQRLQLLNDINFQFEPKRKPKTWDERFHELVEFKTKFGHTRVPRLYGTLGKWVSDQRCKYGNMLKGKKSNMTPEKARRLNEIGMVWAVITLPPPEKRAERKSWNERLQELLEFKDQYGHTVVPQHYPGLGNWVHSQRVNYKLMKQGRKSLMTPSQALQLADAGFTFEVMPRKKKQKIRQSLGNPYPHLPLIANREDLERSDFKDDEDEEEDGEDDMQEG